MQLADPDLVLLESSNHVFRLLELDREMAIVIVHAEVLVDPRIVSAIGAHLLEEFYGLFAGLQVTERFGFQSEVELLSGSLAESGDVLDATPQIFAHRAL